MPRKEVKGAKSGKPKSEKPTASYRADVAEVVSALLGELPGTHAGSGFGGRPAFYVGKKIFAFLHRDGVVLKLPEDTVQRLAGQPGMAQFRMAGKPPMREWLELRRDDAADYRGDVGLFREAAAFAGEAPARPKRKSKS
jgi:hypothetical protein